MDYTTYNRAEQRVLVYTRTRAGGGTWRTDGEQLGWAVDPNLLCLSVEHQVGTEPGTATFRYLPSSSADVAMEAALAHYSLDDQVQVRLLPGAGSGEDEQQDQQDSEMRGTVLFEGVLCRQLPGAQADAMREGEGLRFTAFAMPMLDDLHSDHLVTGRWMIHYDDDLTAQYFIVDTPDLPAIANWRGKPNMSSDRMTFGAVRNHQIWGPGGSAGGLRCFTHEHDSEAEFWTARKLLASLFGMWLYGVHGGYGGAPLDRNQDLAPELRTALLNDSGNGDDDERFRGMDDVLPEINLTGLSVTRAAAAVCDVAGFDLFREPVDDAMLAANDADGVDRRYQIRIQRKHSGPRKVFKMDTRGATYATPEAFHKANDINSATLTRDGYGVRNHVIAVCHAQIECTIPLLPLWEDASEYGGAILGEIQIPITEGYEQTTYQKRYLPGGEQFRDYAHVYRTWGVACAGDEPGKSSAAYAHDQSGYWLATIGGFDWVKYLGLTDASEPVVARMSANAPTTVYWSNRIRQPLPLKSDAARSRGVNYILEVSEDDGATWEVCPLRFETLDKRCGIRLTGISNPATINLSTIRTRDSIPPSIDDSWIKLIADETLRLRLTCCIDTDMAERFDATPTGDSASTYRKSLYQPARSVQVWVHPDSQSLQLPDAQAPGGWHRDESMAAALEDMATARRDALSDLVWSGTVLTANLMPGRWRLGDQIEKIEGRELSFTTRVGSAANYPVIVGMKWSLASGGQGVELTLDDPRHTKGVDGAMRRYDEARRDNRRG